MVGNICNGINAWAPVSVFIHDCVEADSNRSNGFIILDFLELYGRVRADDVEQFGYVIFLFFAEIGEGFYDSAVILVVES